MLKVSACSGTVFNMVTETLALGGGDGYTVTGLGSLRRLNNNTKVVLIGNGKGHQDQPTRS